MRTRAFRSWARREGSERKWSKVGLSIVGAEGLKGEGSGRGNRVWM